MIPPALQRHPKCIATVCLSGGLAEKLEAAAAAGFDGVEIFESDLLHFAGSPADVRRMAADLGLRILLYQPLRDFEAMPPALLARNLARAERKFDVMAQLGVDMMLVCSNVQDIAIADPQRAASDLHQMAQAAARRGFKIGYEALAWGRHTRGWRQAWEIVRRADHPALGLILDSFHTLALGDTLDGLDAVPPEKLFFVQLADAPRLSMDVLSWSRHHRNFPGQGALPVIDFTRDVLQAGYAGPLSLEVFNDAFRSAPARPTALDGLRSLIWLESEALGAGLPAPPRLAGIDFIEFAIDPATGRELETRLRALGFAHAGSHRSQGADLYRQGHINLILNREPIGAAAEHFQQHGPSVCAIGLRIDDAARAIERARALRCQTWHEPAGPNARALPALRAPDGTRCYLIDARDVDPHANANPGAMGFVSIDHLAQALPAHQLASFVLFYRSIFGMLPAAAQAIADPYGLVKSQAMVSPDQRVRMVLEAAERGRTAASQFMAKHAGAGIHRIALRAERLLETIESLDANAARLLRMPDNYYDDAATRWDLDDPQLTRLRCSGVLYERDAGGELLQACTELLCDRFFLEFIQRNGYTGDDAANAPVRMAAQAQLKRFCHPPPD